MDPSLGFAQLLGIAQAKQVNKTTVKQFSTKLSGPKKDPKSKKLSENVQKFLEKKEQEEKQKKIEEQKRKKNLIEMRSDSAKNKIRKHLKVTKSSNKAVIDEAVDNKDTADTLTGRKQCDEDDYGYTSHVSNSIYEKLMSRYEANPEDPMAKFARSKPKEVKDLSSTMNRVKMALKREEEDAGSGRKKKRTSKYGNDDFINDEDERPGKSKEKGWLDGYDEESARKRKEEREKRRRNSSDSDTNVSRHTDRDKDKERREKDREKASDREKEKRLREKEREKKEASKRRLELAKKAPPPIDFQSLLKMANDKKDVPVKAEKNKKPVGKDAEFGGRPMTQKEKEEHRLEEERRLRREGKLPPKTREPVPSQSRPSSSSVKKEKEKDAEISKYKIPSKTPDIPKKKPPRPDPGPQFHPAVVKKPYKPPAHYKSDWRGEDIAPKKSEGWTKPEERKLKMDQARLGKEKSYLNSSQERGGGSGGHKSSKRDYDSGKRDADKMRRRDDSPPKKKDTGVRKFDPSKMNKLPSNFNKRRIESDDSEEEYDSEMDDFIDDTEDKVDIGAEIRNIFGYDRRKFKNEADFDDRSMENNKFSNIMMEEARSAKIGKMEDLADMRREEEELKRKMKKLRR